MYTCPMHPQIRSEKQDSCLKCGMTLVDEKNAGREEYAINYPDKKNSPASKNCC